MIRSIIIMVSLLSALVLPTSVALADEDSATVTITFTVPLTISDVSVSDIGYHSATISWKTNGDATSQVFYDTQFHDDIADYAYHTDEDTTLVSEHSIRLTGLASSTIYHYKIKSVALVDSGEFVAISDDYFFTTLSPPEVGVPAVSDTTPPTISDILVSNISKTSADISWKTNEASDSQVKYWTSLSKLSPLDTAMVIYHLVHLTDLAPGTTYRYKTMSRDAAGNLAVSDEHTFTTLPGVAIFTSSSLSISPSGVYIGETVAITAVVANTGDGAGSYKVVLKINGVVEATKDITLNAGASGEVVFTTAKEVAGIYSVEVDGLRGSFTVREKPEAPPPPPPEEVPPVKPSINWPLIGGIIGGVVIVGLGVFFWMRRGRVKLRQE